MLGERYKGKWWVLSEGSSVKGSPEDKQPSGPCIKGSAKISWQVILALYTGSLNNSYPGNCLSKKRYGQCSGFSNI